MLVDFGGQGDAVLLGFGRAVRCAAVVLSLRTVWKLCSPGYLSFLPGEGRCPTLCSGNSCLLYFVPAMLALSIFTRSLRAFRFRAYFFVVSSTTFCRLLICCWVVGIHNLWVVGIYNGRKQNDPVLDISWMDTCRFPVHLPVGYAMPSSEAASPLVGGSEVLGAEHFIHLHGPFAQDASIEVDRRCSCLFKPLKIASSSSPYLAPRACFVLAPNTHVLGSISLCLDKIVLTVDADRPSSICFLFGSFSMIANVFFGDKGLRFLNSMTAEAMSAVQQRKWQQSLSCSLLEAKTCFPPDMRWEAVNAPQTAVERPYGRTRRSCCSHGKVSNLTGNVIQAKLAKGSRVTTCLRQAEHCGRAATVTQAARLPLGTCLFLRPLTRRKRYWPSPVRFAVCQNFILKGYHVTLQSRGTAD